MSFFSIKNKWWYWLFWQLFGIFILTLMVLAYYLYQLDNEVVEKFEGARWEIPSRVYAQPLSLYEGKELTKKQLLFELSLLRYTRSRKNRVGHYYRKGNTFYLHTRPFQFPDEKMAAGFIKIQIKKNQIVRLTNAKTGQDLDLIRLEPYFIGGIYPRKHEDRVLVRIDDVPQSMIDTLLAVEDRKFYEHSGVAPLSIVRALIANIRAGARVQGGSTLTQQLVKNFYLSNEKTIIRKLNEAFMALLLEWRYSKNEILEAYLNEIYLGQDGKRAIHGFGLAAQFYFDEPLSTLNKGQIALLVGLVKGASYYDPRRFPERANKRRQIVLSVQKKLNILSDGAYAQFSQSALGVKKDKPSGVGRYPAFLDLVKRQLRQDYRPEDLSSAGLRLFSTLDPLVQEAAEQSVLKRLPRLERKARLKKNKLEVAAIVTDTGSGAIRALVGGRDFRGHGFNRVLDAKRQIGSLIKPAIYLTALSNPKRYQLNTLLNDSPISVKLDNGRRWSPENYDQKFHGEVSLISALANSYNTSTVRLGMNVGLKNVAETLKKLGLERHFNLYPSMLLGAVSLSPFEVLKMYQTISAQGFQTPIRAIKSVTTANGEVLSKYPIEVEQTLKPEAVFLLNRAMQEVMKNGTGRGAYSRFPASFSLAGKSGTTNSFRDSWFAGMSGDKVTVVWLGADDNQTIRLTGSAGALKIWTDIMYASAHRSLDVPVPERIVFAEVDAMIHKRHKVICQEDMLLPFVSGYLSSASIEFDCDE